MSDIVYYLTIIERNLSGYADHAINKFKTIEELSMYLIKFRNHLLNPFK